MKYCSECGKEINEEAQYCPNCGNEIKNERNEKNDNSFQNRETENSWWKSLTRFISEIRIEIKESIDQEIQKEPDIPKDFKCPYCDNEDTFPIEKNETEIKNKGYSMSNGCCGMCLLGPFGLLCGLFGTGSKIKSKSTTWWGCKNCGKQHLAQHSAIEMIDLLIGKMVLNCFCYGSIGSMILYVLLNEIVQGFLKTILILVISAIIGIITPLRLAETLFKDIDRSLGYSVWEILDAQKKKECFDSIKLSILILAGSLVFVFPILSNFAE
ncbi:zinc-ribbon domain-containing protein [Faecalimonas sp.]